jgi:SAM-dependent methyltransferase
MGLSPVIRRSSVAKPAWANEDGLMAHKDRKDHWEAVYRANGAMGVSWYQEVPRLSLELIRFVAPATARIIDVGGGASLLVDRLLDQSFSNLTVLDISEVALERSKERLGSRANKVQWLAADVTTAIDLGGFDVWHDRAVFHFMTDVVDRQKYVELARRTVRKGGHLIIATFADNGPVQCSGLDVCRYNAETLAAELGEGFSLMREAKETHSTPRGSSQAFFYGVFRRR